MQPDKPTSPFSKRTPEPPKANILSGATTMTGSVLGLGAVGYFIDKRFETTPYGLLVGCLLGVAVGMWELYKAIYGKRS
jgi:F0F1-type ATP synthase assembly protein I